MADRAGRKRGPAAPPAVPALRKPVSIERSVDEGVLIASSAVVMEVKNHIIVDAIRDGSPFSAANVVAAVRRELLVLAEENESSAQRVQGLAVAVQTRRGANYNPENYQVDDHPTLTRRGIIYVMLAAELERLGGDDDFVAELAERARVQAWAEVGEAIESRLQDSVSRASDPLYDEEKEARIRALLTINFRALEKQAKRRGRAAARERPRWRRPRDLR